MRRNYRFNFFLCSYGGGDSINELKKLYGDEFDPKLKKWAEKEPKSIFRAALQGGEGSVNELKRVFGDEFDKKFKEIPEYRAASENGFKKSDDVIRVGMYGEAPSDLVYEALYSGHQDLVNNLKTKLGIENFDAVLKELCNKNKDNVGVIVCLGLHGGKVAIDEIEKVMGEGFLGTVQRTV